VLDAALMNLKLHARVALSGLISEYNSTSGPVGARNLWQLIVKRASIRGLYTGDFLPAAFFRRARRKTDLATPLERWWRASGRANSNIQSTYCNPGSPIRDRSLQFVS
jgi:hypothetical protein